MTIRALNKPEHFVIAAAVVMNTTLHLIADYNAGYHGDEFLHIDAGRHLSSGYMDFPPVIGILAFIQNLFRSDSLIINHLFVHLATILITVYCGLITMRLGGKWLAVIVSLSCILFSPGFAVSHSLFLPVVFEQLMWVICLYYLVSFCNNPHDKYLILFGIFSAIGFLTKYSTLFLISGLFLAILILRNDLFKRKSLWIAALVFLVIISPNVLWQVRNGFPVFHHITTLYHTQLNHLSFSGEIKSLLFFLNPLNAVFWLSGLLLVPFIRKFHQYRLVNFTLLFAFGLLLFSKGKAYYYFPVILGVLPFGAIFAEQVLQERQWILKGYLGIVFVSGVFWLPKAIALFPLDEYIRLYHLNKRDDNRIPITFENFYSKEIWETVLKSVSETYNNLPPEEKKNCLVWGRHYSQAGGVNLLGPRYGLPLAFSFHSSCYCWVPQFSQNSTIIVIADPEWDKNHWLRYFNNVEEMAIVDNHYTSDENWYYQRIFLCRELKYSSDQLKELFSSEHIPLPFLQTSELLRLCHPSRPYNRNSG